MKDGIVVQAAGEERRLVQIRREADGVARGKRHAEDQRRVTRQLSRHTSIEPAHTEAAAKLRNGVPVLR